MYTTTKVLAEIADREAIRDCLLRYSRAVDRRDEKLLHTVYWPGAIDDHLIFKGTAAEFIPWAMELLSGMDQTMHALTNILIDIELPFARVETYWVAYHKRDDVDGRSMDNTMGGRYLDRMEKRNDEWRISDRVIVIDWMTEYPESGDWATRLPGVKFRTNIRPEDPSYKLFAGSRFG
jgi:hypothetical protein